MYDTIQAVTFDLGGTLLTTRDDIAAAYAEALAQNGIYIDPDSMRAAYADARAEAYGDENVPLAERAARRAYFRERLLRKVGIINPGHLNMAGAIIERAHSSDLVYRLFAEDAAPDVLRLLQQHGYRLGIVANNWSPIRAALAALGIAEFFDEDAIIISEEVGLEKPDAGIFTLAAAGLRVPPLGILHVGDDYAADIEGAHKAGYGGAVLVDRSGANVTGAGLPYYEPVIHALPALIGLLNPAPAR